MTHHSDDESRRNFLRDSSMLLASALPCTVATAGNVANQPTSSQANIRFGLLGCGHSGVQLARALTEQYAKGNISNPITAFADVFSDCLQRALRSYSSQIRKNDVQPRPAARIERFVGERCVQSLLESNIDALIIATPSYCKPDIVEAAIDAGKHIFLEQPIASHRDDIARFRIAGRKALSAGLTVLVDRSHARLGKLLRHPGSLELIGDCDQLRFESTVYMPRFKPSRNDEELRNWRHEPAYCGPIALEQHTTHLVHANRLFGSLPLGGLLDDIASSADSSSSMAKVSQVSSLRFFYPNDKTIVSRCLIPTSVGVSASSRLFCTGTFGETELSKHPKESRSKASPEKPILEVAENNMLQEFIRSIANRTGLNNFREAAQTLQVAIDSLA